VKEGTSKKHVAAMRGWESLAGLIWQQQLSDLLRSSPALGSVAKARFEDFFAIGGELIVEPIMRRACDPAKASEFYAVTCLTYECWATCLLKM